MAAILTRKCLYLVGATYEYRKSELGSELSDRAIYVHTCVAVRGERDVMVRVDKYRSLFDYGDTRTP